MIGTILQPTYLPWLGYFEMLDACDLYVVFDHVQYVKKERHNRNRIKGPNGEIVLSVPIKKATQKTSINEIEVSYSENNPLQKHWKSIEHAYHKAPYFALYRDTLESIFNEKHDMLMDLSLNLIRTFCQLLEINVKIVFSSDYQNTQLQDSRTGRVVDLCLQTGIKVLYDAKGAEQFIDSEMFNDHNLEVKFQNYNHPEYRQQNGEFLPYMSVIDLLFNEGPNSLAIIRRGAGR